MRANFAFGTLAIVAIAGCGTPTLEGRVERLERALQQPTTSQSEHAHRPMTLRDVRQPADVVAEKTRQNCRYSCDTVYCCRWGPPDTSGGTVVCQDYNCANWNWICDK